MTNQRSIKSSDPESKLANMKEFKPPELRLTFPRENSVLSLSEFEFLEGKYHFIA